MKFAELLHRRTTVSSWLLVGPPHDPRKFCITVSSVHHLEARVKRGWYRVLTIEMHILPNDRPLCLILFIHRYPNRRPLPLRAGIINPPSTDLPHKMLKFFTSQIQPALQHASFHNPHALPHRHRNPDPHQLLEAAYIRDEIGVEIIAV